MKKRKVKYSFYFDNKCVSLLPFIIIGDWFNMGFVVQIGWLSFVFNWFIKEVEQ